MGSNTNSLPLPCTCYEGAGAEAYEISLAWANIDYMGEFDLPSVNF